MCVQCSCALGMHACLHDHEKIAAVRAAMHVCACVCVCGCFKSVVVREQYGLK